jgi:hypothetical protein
MSLSNPNLQSPDSPELPPLPQSARHPRHNGEHATFGPPPGRHDARPPPPKLQPPPPPRALSPQNAKRPMSPTVVERQPSNIPPSSYLSQFNRHSKNTSVDSTLSDQSLRSATMQPARSSQDFQDLLQRVERSNPHAIVPQKSQMGKKKSYDQMPTSKPGIFQRIFQRGDKPKDISADSVCPTSSLMSG